MGTRAVVLERILDKRRIIIMAKLASYDKNFGEKDRQALKYFRTDYVYRKNMWTRFCVVLGCLIIGGVYALHFFLVEGNSPFVFDYQGELLNLGIFMLVMMGIYTLISTKIHVSEFNQAERRLSNYLELIKKLGE